MEAAEYKVCRTCHVWRPLIDTHSNVLIWLVSFNFCYIYSTVCYAFLCSVRDVYLSLVNSETN